MGYPGRQNIYDAAVLRMVTKALEEQELQFRQAHEQDTEELLPELIRDWASVHGYTLCPLEIAGGSCLAERFVSWEVLIRRAGLDPPTHPNRRSALIGSERKPNDKRSFTAEKRQRKRSSPRSDWQSRLRSGKSVKSDNITDILRLMLIAPVPS